MLSNDDRFFLRKNGYVISSKAFFDTEYGDVNDEVALILRTHRNFAQYILFDRDGIKCSSNDQDIILNDELFERLLLKPQKVSIDLTGDEKKLYLKDCNYCSRFSQSTKIWAWTSRIELWHTRIFTLPMLLCPCIGKIVR